MPYPNESSCRIRSPGQFQPESFRRIKSGKLNIIIGRLKGQTTTTTQALRYPKETWTEAEARTHCEEQKGRFEPSANATMNQTIRQKAGH